jgi:hypothetical protein
MTDAEEIISAVDGAHLVHYSMDHELLYVWFGGRQVNIISAINGEFLDCFHIPAFMPRSFVIDAINENIQECFELADTFWES